MPAALSLVARLVDRDRREEILGDLCELRSRESAAAYWADVVSICLRAPGTRRWAGAGTAALLLLGMVLAPRQPSHRTVSARDPAGEFALEFAGSRVVGASLDGVPVPAERLVQGNGRLVIKHGAGSGDLNIRIRPDGSFYWQGRPPHSRPTP